MTPGSMMMTSTPDGSSSTRSESVIASSANFDAEEIIVMDDRAVVRWCYSWGSGHVRGIDLFRVRDGKVAEKFSYVKG